jgi:hypothetical protein
MYPQIGPITSYEGTMTLSITAFSITTSSINDYYNNITALCRYVECRVLFIVIVIMNVIVLSVVMRKNVVMLSVMEPKAPRYST